MYSGICRRVKSHTATSVSEEIPALFFGIVEWLSDLEDGDTLFSEMSYMIRITRRYNPGDRNHVKLKVAP